jgi:NADH-quinone oxidoreductase subunit N
MSNDLIVLFLGLETLSIALYVMAAMHLRRIQSQEAGIKYFVLGAFSSAFFLYGIAMVYGATGTTNLVKIDEFLSGNVLLPIKSDLLSGATLNSPLLLLGLALMLVGLGFKVAAVPFHFWSPDVYDGAPTPVTAYMASGVKAAGFAALVRVYLLGFSTHTSDWRPLVVGLAVASLVVGSTLAIVQTNVKRTLAYSSIAHAGFILMALSVATPKGVQAVVFYLAAYLFMVAGSFGVVTLVARRGDGHTSLRDFRGLGRTNPQLALVFTVFLLAQAGVPLTTGFVAKFYAVVAAVSERSYWLAAVAMVSSVVAAFLYLRIIIVMYLSEDEPSTVPVAVSERIAIPFGAGLALAICAFVTVGFGIFPGSLTDAAAKSQPALVKVAEPGPTVGADGIPEFPLVPADSVPGAP